MAFPKLLDHVALRLEPFGGILLNQKNGKIQVINQTGADILSLSTGKNSIQKIIGEICKKYDVHKKKADKYIKQFISSAEKRAHLIMLPQKITVLPKLNITGSRKFFTPIEAIIELTMECTGKCIYCFANAGKARVNELSGENWIKTLDILKRNGIMRLCITGGNPLLHPDINKILKYCSENFTFTILTEGGDISDDLAKFLSEIKPAEIQVSLDSYKPRINNTLRGKNSFDNATKSIKILKKYDTNVTVAATITSLNYHDIVRTVSFVQELGANSFDLGPLDPLGRATTLKKYWFVSERRYGELEKNLVRLYGSFIGKAERNEQLSNEKTQDKVSFCAELYYRSLTINSRGEAKPCILKPETIFRHCHEKLISHPLINLKENGFLKQMIFQECRRIKGEIPSKKNCHNCKFSPMCRDCVIIGFYLARKNANCNLKFWKVSE